MNTKELFKTILMGHRWRRKWHPTPVFLPGESQGWRSLVGCRLWGRTESDMTEAPQQLAMGHRRCTVSLRCIMLYLSALCRYVFFYKLKIECLWQPYIDQVHQHLFFPNSICSLYVSMTYFGNSSNILSFSLSLYLLW